jgi:hypothetical protein
VLSLVIAFKFPFITHTNKFWVTTPKCFNSLVLRFQKPQSQCLHQSYTNSVFNRNTFLRDKDNITLSKSGCYLKQLTYSAIYFTYNESRTFSAREFKFWKTFQLLFDMVSSLRCSFKIIRKIEAVRSLFRRHIAKCILGSHNNVCRCHPALWRFGADHGEFQGHSSCFKLTVGSSVSQVTQLQRGCPTISNADNNTKFPHLYKEM